MRISDWSSDVCSSDLLVLNRGCERIEFFGENGLDCFGLHPAMCCIIHAAFLALRQSATAASTASFAVAPWRSEEHTSELQSLMRISYAVFCLKKKKQTNQHTSTKHSSHEIDKNILYN